MLMKSLCMGIGSGGWRYCHSGLRAGLEALLIVNHDRNHGYNAIYLTCHVFRLPEIVKITHRIIHTKAVPSNISVFGEARD